MKIIQLIVVVRIKVKVSMKDREKKIISVFILLHEKFRGFPVLFL